MSTTHIAVLNGYKKLVSSPSDMRGSWGAPRNRLNICWLLPLCFACVSASVGAQEIAGSPPRAVALQNVSPMQNAPALQNAAIPSGPASLADGQSPQPQSSGRITLVVRDIHGAAVPGVLATLVEHNNAVAARGTADSNGTFTFSGLTPGTYRVKVSAEGLKPYVSAELTVAVGETCQVPIILTGIPTTSTTVNVVANIEEVAQSQVAEQEKQRVFGVLPNYYVSYIWDAAPMTPKLKFGMALRSVTDPVTFLVAAGVAGVEHAHKTFPGYGQEFEGYSRRFGSAYADTALGIVVGHAILPSVLHQDPRYFYQGSGTFSSRLFYAISAAVICRGDNGQLQPNYSGVLGSFAAAGISNLYRAPEDRNPGLTFRNGLIVVGSSAVVNVLREFLSRKATPSVPAFANGKP